MLFSFTSSSLLRFIFISCAKLFHLMFLFYSSSLSLLLYSFNSKVRFHYFTLYIFKFSFSYLTFSFFLFLFLFILRHFLSSALYFYVFQPHPWFSYQSFHYIMRSFYTLYSLGIPISTTFLHFSLQILSFPLISLYFLHDFLLLPLASSFFFPSSFHLFIYIIFNPHFSFTPF